ncbi:hypothetical protein [Clostridium sp.]|uniref:hypothetical protein n=1 Tax=Clostridium sp. TaxID=1506 RepID=UPI0028472C4D|nr:hypothetical protein [Clostridium sp.]MDR3593819.1 hypothetical protein [Clostridium sp.]
MGNTPKNLNDIEEILYKQVELLAEKSKDCELEDLRENTRTILSAYSELKVI